MRSFPFFPGITGNHSCLDSAGMRYRIGNHITVKRQKPRHFLGYFFKIASVGKKPVFNDFSQTCGHLSSRERFQHLCIGNNSARLKETSNHVLAPGHVEAGFSSDRRINLCQKRRRHLYKPAVRACTQMRQKPANIPDNNRRREQPRRFFCQLRLQQATTGFFSMDSQFLNSSPSGRTTVSVRDTCPQIRRTSSA